MKIFMIIVLSVFPALLGACGGPGLYQMAYRPIAEPIGKEQAYMLDEGAKPRLILSKEFQEDLKIFTDQNYTIVGESFFNGPLEQTEDAVSVGETLRVTHVLLSAEYLYMGERKAYKFLQNYDYIAVPTQRNGYFYYRYEAVPNPVSVPYKKEVPIYKQRAVYLVKLK